MKFLSIPFLTFQVNIHMGILVFLPKSSQNVAVFLRNIFIKARKVFFSAFRPLWKDMERERERGSIIFNMDHIWIRYIYEGSSSLNETLPLYQMSSIWHISVNENVIFKYFPKEEVSSNYHFQNRSYLDQINCTYKWRVLKH